VQRTASISLEWWGAAPTLPRLRLSCWPWSKRCPSRVARKAATSLRFRDCVDRSCTNYSLRICDFQGRIQGQVAAFMCIDRASALFSLSRHISRRRNVVRVAR
jgi:hypothetical protein